MLSGAAVLCPLAAEAQQAGSGYRIGFLRNGPAPPPYIEGFRQGLREVGYVEGRNISIEYGLAPSADQLPGVAAELVSRNVDVIIAAGATAIPAAKNATLTIPIVFVTAADPIAAGLVTSLPRPGGNVTGFYGIDADLMGKRLELLREAIPDLSRVAILCHAANPGNAEWLRQAELGASALGLRLQTTTVRDPGDFERAFEEMRDADAVIQLGDSLFTSHPRPLVELAARKQLPVMYGIRDFVEVGGLMAYGADFPDQYRRAAAYVERILNGVKPADLPVQQPTKFELVINAKTASAIGIALPPSLLARADEVIE